MVTGLNDMFAFDHPVDEKFETSPTTIFTEIFENSCKLCQWIPTNGLDFFNNLRYVANGKYRGAMKMLNIYFEDGVFSFCVSLILQSIYF